MSLESVGPHYVKDTVIGGFWHPIVFQGVEGASITLTISPSESDRGPDRVQELFVNMAISQQPTEVEPEIQAGLDHLSESPISSPSSSTFPSHITDSLRE